MKTAMRVLAALNEKRDPTPADIDELRGLAPDFSATGLDELACEVIQRALRHRAEARVTMQNGEA